MKTRMIYTKFWRDSYVSGLKPKEKLVFIYLFTNNDVNICGIYELPDKYIKFDLGLKQTELDKIKQKFMEDNKFMFVNGWVKIVNSVKYNIFTGEKNEIAKERELALIPIKIKDFTYPIDRVSIPYRYSLNHNPNHNLREKKEREGRKSAGKDSINKKEKNSPLIKEIIDYLNKKADKNFNPKTKNTVDCINARLKEGHLLEAFKWVIDVKCGDWKGEITDNGKDMDAFLRPATLFGNKFESYLNQKERLKKEEEK